MPALPRIAAFIAIASVYLIARPAIAQPSPLQRAETKSDPVPIEIALHDLHDAYSATTADAVQVRFRAPGGAERSDGLIVRVRATPNGVESARVEFGPLRLFASGGHITLINTNAPSKYLQREYAAPLTAASLSGVTPPIPLPELALANQNDPFTDPSPYTTGVTWTSAAIETSLRGRFLTLSGAGKNSRITIAANPDNGRLVHLTATITSRDGESTLDLQVHPIDPGDASAWAISTDGRERVASLTDLHPAAPPTTGQVQPGQPVPDLILSGPDHSRWSLHTALESAAKDAAPKPAPSLVLILFREPANPDQAADAVKSAQAASAALDALKDTAPFTTAAAVVIELGDFSPEKWVQAQSAWSPASTTSKRLLLWASSAAQTIDRFIPGAQAIAIIITPDRTLRAAIRLDGRPSDAAPLSEELRAGLTSPR